MKKGFLLIFLVFIASNSFSQANKEKQRKIKWGCSVAINSIRGQMAYGAGSVTKMDDNGNMVTGANRNSKSISLSLIPKYFISNDFLVRLEFGVSKISQSSNDDYFGSSVHYTSNESLKQNITKIAPALQWNYFRKNIFEAYSGLSLIYFNYGKYYYNAYGENRDSVTEALKFWAIEKITIEGGYASGISAFTGFNIYLQKHFSLGFELSSSFLYYKVGGSRIVEDVSQSPPNPPSSTQFNWKYSYKGLKFANILSSFNLSIWF